jgi:hypothetical protein
VVAAEAAAASTAVTAAIPAATASVGADAVAGEGGRDQMQARILHSRSPRACAFWVAPPRGIYLLPSLLPTLPLLSRTFPQMLQLSFRSMLVLLAWAQAQARWIITRISRSSHLQGNKNHSRISSSNNNNSSHSGTGSSNVRRIPPLLGSALAMSTARMARAITYTEPTDCHVNASPHLSWFLESFGNYS